MVVKKSIFGTGWVLNGVHDGINCGGVEFDRTLQVIRSGRYTSNKIVVRYNLEVGSFSWENQAHIMTAKENNSLMGQDFMAGEAMGCEPPQKVY